MESSTTEFQQCVLTLFVCAVHLRVDGVSFPTVYLSVSLRKGQPLKTQGKT